MIKDKLTIKEPFSKLLYIRHIVKRAKEKTIEQLMIAKNECKRGMASMLTR